MKSSLLTLILLSLPAMATAQTAPPAKPQVELWRLDCGSIDVSNINFFSDTEAYPDHPLQMTDSCYLIRHGEEYLLWDAGLPLDAAPQGPGPQPKPGPAITKQLAEIGVMPEQVTRVGISHAHFDHMGQAADFPAATLLIGAGDWAELTSDKPGFGIDPKLAQPWRDGGKVEAVEGDLDVFGDSSVTMLKMPGHTPGETALLVRLADFGPVLLSGDVVHFAQQLLTGSVPPFNVNRADSLASMARLEGLAKAQGARLVIQHDPDHIGRLPAFPASAQ
ncbi:N-acyl homoserine lactonase family protein [Paracoccus suum]|uniref:N-acyl homoserine lactonase family protein n=2 Tax=Paracoccus suum TaxID=2259340 RepID=A0A344PGA9_9RHOB|nr:N-acyl homoserine lactonase family protein [Paracoccus suum]